MTNFSTLDTTLFFGYIFLIVGFGIWLSRKKGGAESTQDYFLASKALPWWAVGGSLIASNISTEQILGMNGSAFRLGMAIGTYELMAALTLLVVAKFFLPIFIDKEIYTMPQFLEKRFDGRVRIGLAFFWVILFAFINITTVLYLGGLAIQSLLGVNMIVGIIGLVLYSATFSIFGGLKAVVWTDVAQVIVLVLGGLLASVMVVSAVGDGGFFSGLSTMIEKAPEKFDMILTTESEFYSDLPGISVLIGGMWVANLYYWGTNQYIIQRALAAKSLPEAQKGIAFAAFMKLFLPIIVVLPGIAAFVLNADIQKPDEAFPWVLSNYVDNGFKGIVFAGLVAAIGSSISSMVNSTSTIFTLDIYKSLIRPNTSDAGLVRVGKITSAVALLIGAVLSPTLSSLDQVFQYIQEYTGFISPGVLVVFLFGMFWKRATANAAFVVVLLAIPISAALKIFVPDLPFLDRMGSGFLILSAIMIALSLLEQRKGASETNAKQDQDFRRIITVAIMGIGLPVGIKVLVDDIGVSSIFGIAIIILAAVAIGITLLEKGNNDQKALSIKDGLFKTQSIFNIASAAIGVILVTIYALLW